VAAIGRARTLLGSMASRPLFGVLRGAFEAYQRSLKARPVLTNMVTSAIVMGSGDRIAQHIEQKSPAELRSFRSWIRTSILASYSMCVGSPFFTVFWRFLDRRIVGSGRFVPAFSKALCTAVIASPLMNGGFYAWATTAEHYMLTEPVEGGKSFEELRRKLEVQFREKYLLTLARSAQVWIPINTLNFMLVPPHLRIVVSQFWATAWSSYLSWLHHQRGDSPVGADL
jgi:protein Mpv17